MSPQKTVRAQARALLKGGWGRAVCAFVIALLPVYIITGMIYIVAMIVYEGVGIDAESVPAYVDMLIIYPIVIIFGALFSPMFNGYVRLFYRSASGQGIDMSDLYYYFSAHRYQRTVQLNLSFALRMLLPALLFFMPVIIYEIISMSIDNGAVKFTDTVLYLDFQFLLNVLSVILVALYSLRYFTVFTLYVENESFDNSELFAMSKSIMKSYSGAAAKLIFSYTPWMLLCLTVLPILYVAPYMTQGLCVGARWMTQAACAERRC